MEGNLWYQIMIYSSTLYWMDVDFIVDHMVTRVEQVW